MSFKNGDRVSWNSQAGGYRKRKEGVILHTVPAGVHPRVVVTPECLPKGTKFTSPRTHESYLVLVGKQTRYHWPRVCHLKGEKSTLEKQVHEAAIRCADMAAHGSRDVKEYESAILECLEED